jgi:hypothetical protein
MNAGRLPLRERRQALQARCAAQRQELTAVLGALEGELQGLEQRVGALRRVPVAALIAGAAGLSLTVRRVFTVIEGVTWAVGLLRNWRRAH